MKAKPYIYSLLLLACFVTLPLSAQKKVTLLFTNDVHSRIEPLSPDSPDTLIAGKGGFLRVASYVEQVRKEMPNVLVFDSGDFSQGTPYYTLFKGEVEVQLMNAIGYDASTIGNHEFDFGVANMARIFAMANFPILCANYDVTGTPLEGLVKPSMIIEKAGLKIGVFGVGTQLSGLVQEKMSVGVTYLNPYEVANKVAAELKAQGCDMVICLSHLGHTSSAKSPTGDVDLAKISRNIDVILGGHSHTFLAEPVIVPNLDGKNVYITQNGKNAVFVGRLDITL